MTDKLRINRADEAAAEQTGYPTLFYAIRRKFGERIATLYLRKHQQAQRREK